MKWKEYANGFGLGHRLGVDLPSEDGGNIPDTTAYDKEYHHSWNSCTMVTMGIGQDKMQETPLQIANAMCIVANKGFYYIPHFVQNIEGAAEEDTLLSRFHEKHSAVSHISDEDYDVVQNGMQGVVDFGTARSVKIPGIDMCAKTGTAENNRIINGKFYKLKNHSIFACFAPRENPKIAVAVIVENGGFGADAAGPIASLLVEKYLNDTIATDRLALEDRMTNTNLMPGYLVRMQYRADSIRAAEWADQSGDSTRWIKYQTPSFRSMMLDTSYNSKSPLYVNLHKAPPYKSALAERLARTRAQAAAAEQHPADSSKQNRTPDTSGAPSKPSPAIRPRPVDTAIKKSPPRAPVKEDSIHKDSTR
jgi:penicillin-binding protein 2